jgi:hypothetical protein
MLIFSCIHLRIKGKREHWRASGKTKSFVMEYNL